MICTLESFQGHSFHENATVTLMRWLLDRLRDAGLDVTLPRPDF
jgi:hypothetical protein